MLMFGTIQLVIGTIDIRFGLLFVKFICLAIVSRLAVCDASANASIRFSLLLLLLFRFLHALSIFSFG